ncbi:hypothetical protein BJ165DRAFT_1598696 [Panaeolus papilionaceus]|nr:hypothetical protein BJ165DRAFT_1598696 [Panaeolus papilionaceus]
MNTPEYANLKITGDISVESVTQKLPDDAFVYTLLGPTGAGKSCLIQALAGGSQDLGISKNQLAGVTQTAAAYRLVNVLFQDEGRDIPIFLVDTPGFSDPKISHLGIFAAKNKFQRKIKKETRVKVLFLTPVTNTRVPGTKRRTIEMLTAMYEPSKYSFPLTIVTTMWNTLYTERSHQRAEENYAQLRDDIWKAWLSILISRITQLTNFEQGFSDMGVTTVRFTNTRESALAILDTGPWENDLFVNAVAGGALLFCDLRERIENALQQKEIIASDLTHPEAQTNLELRAIHTKNHRDNEKTLKKFVKEFLVWRSPPVGYEDAHYHLLKSLLGTYIPLTMSIRIFVLQCQVARLVRHAKRRGAKWFEHKV